MVRRNSNQRITKIKRDIDLDLLEQAELIPVEQGVTVMNPGDNLTPYPTINNLRNWVRKYLLSGINGVFISGFNIAEGTAYLQDGTTTSTFRVPARKEQWASAYPKFTTVLDGLIINTQEVKVIDCADDFQDDEVVPKPGLQLSNFKHLFEYEVTLPKNANRTETTRIARVFRDIPTNNTFNQYHNAVVGYLMPTFLEMGALQQTSGTMFNYQWHYWDTDGIINRVNYYNSAFKSYPARRINCSADLVCGPYYAYAMVDWWTNVEEYYGFITFWTFPTNVNYKLIFKNSNSSSATELFRVASPNNFLNHSSDSYYICTGNNSSLTQELLSSPYMKATTQDLTLNISDGVTTIPAFIIPTPKIY